jgi:uncharacterized protein (TIGR02284 family)
MRLWALLFRLSVTDSSADNSAFDHGAGVLGFRDFPGLPTAKENRNDSRRTLLINPRRIRLPTRKEQMSMETKETKLTNKEVEETLRDVIQSLIDGQEGFQKLGEHLKDATLKSYFMAESLKRASFRGELENLLHQGGVQDVQESGTLSGAVHRSWGNLKAHLGGSDLTLLETAEQGEDAAKKAYKDALEKELPLPVHQLLSTQYAHIQTSHDYVKAARDSSK